MRYLAALLAGTALCWPSLVADAQQVPNPAPMDAIVGWAGTNAALKTRTYKQHPVLRAGFAAAGDGGGATYIYSSTACTLNGGNGDDGSQVKAESVGCWNLAAPGATVDLRVFGAKANTPAFDSGPAIRAAALYSELSGATISVPAGAFYFNTLDPAGTGALVLGKTDMNTPGPGYPLPTFHPMANFVGQVWHTQADMCFLTEPTFSLGPGLNRPLVFVKANSVSVRFENLCLSGNRPNQTGFLGGPQDKLYVVQLEDATAAAPASSVTAKNVAFRDGYNGNLYQGAYRSLLYLTDVWSLYSGQTVSDTQIMLLAYDSIIYNLQQGFSTGFGVVVGGGVNMTFTAGGFFFNGGPGLYVSNSTTDLQVTGMRFNDNQCHALEIDNAAPIPGNRVGGRVYTGLVFNDNSQSGNNLCDDIVAIGDSVGRDTFIGTIFDGPLKSAATIYPRYNVSTGSNVRLFMNGTVVASGGSNASGFTNDYLSIVGDLQVNPSWVPHLWGTTSVGAPGAETPTDGWPKGQWARNGKLVTASGSILLNAFTATGSMIVGGFPHTARTGTISSCALGRVTGFAPSSGYATLSMMIGGDSQTASLFKSGPSAVGADVLPTDLHATIGQPLEVSFTCTYPVKDSL